MYTCMYACTNKYNTTHAGYKDLDSASYQAVMHRRSLLNWMSSMQYGRACRSLH